MRIFGCGFGLADPVIELSSALGGGTIETTVVRPGGTHSLKISSLSSGVPQGVDYKFFASSGTGDAKCRTYLRVNVLPTAENRIIALNNAATSDIVWITLDSGGLLRLYDEDGQIGSASSALSLDTWYYVGPLLNASIGAGTDDEVRAYIDLVEFAGSAAGRNINVGVDAFRVGGNLGSEAQTQGVWYFAERCETAADATWACQLKSQAAGTTQTGASRTQNDTTWRTNGDAVPRNPSLVSHTDPQGSGAWTPALLNTMIAGVNVTDANPDLHFTALWAVVEWSAGVGGRAPLPVFMNIYRQQRAKWGGKRCELKTTTSRAAPVVRGCGPGPPGGG